nr:E3 ubiquitin-protein ligase SHPRH [Onthophagus taurus]
MYRGVSDYVPKVKKTQKPHKSSARKGAPSGNYKFSKVNPDNQEFCLGNVWFGTTNNLLPLTWTHCDAELNWDNEMVILHFDKEVVVVNVTIEMQFLKDLLFIKLFNFDLKIEDENVIVTLYLKELPLPKFSSKIGSVLKTVFFLTQNISSDNNDKASIKSSCIIEHFDDLYKNIAELREPFPNKEINHVQLKPELRPYQQSAVQWMLHRESVIQEKEIINPLYEKITLNNKTEIYFDKYTGHIEPYPPIIKSFQSCGILADEMGLGKTVEILALTLIHTRQSIYPIYTKNEVNHSLESETPTIEISTKVRKRKSNFSEDITHVIAEKKPKRENKREKSLHRRALEAWYNNMLGLNKNVEKKSLLQCVCGDKKEEDVVECSKCGKQQHSGCLGYQEKFGAYICPQCWIQEPLLVSKATLIITPISLKQQWCDEICKHVNGNFKVLQYGTGQNIQCVYPTDLLEYDIVITTYNVLQSELRLRENGEPISLRRPSKYALPGSPISLINWWRLCLDEAQTVETPNSLISVMAKKLSAQYRWAVTGTPISKDISDLFGLIDYLQITPYSDEDIWRNILYLPYINNRKGNMHRFLSTILWRTSKNDVLDQINIPSQTTKEYWVNFTAVEKFFYDREQELSTTEFFATLKDIDLTLPLKSLNKSLLKKIMIPLLSLRQACVHHQTVRGRYLATKKSVKSMENLLDALIATSLVQCEESLRSLVSAMNGLAGLFLIQTNPKAAADMYRKVMAISKEYVQDQNEIGLEVDKLQQIHVLYNLIEILELHETIPKCVEDDNLKCNLKKIEVEYIEKFMKPVLTTKRDNSEFISQISELQNKFVLEPGQWFADVLNLITVKNYFSEYYKKFLALSSNIVYSDNVDNYNTERAILYEVTTWDEKLTLNKSIVESSINELLVFKEEDDSYTIPENLIKSACECHLRPEKTKRKKIKEKICPICFADVKLKEYESCLFSMTLNRDDNAANTGCWKPCVQETMLRALLSSGKALKADKSLLHDAAIHLEILELLKKQFKEIRKLWRLIDDVVKAKDELSMCKIRLQLKEKENDEVLPKNSQYKNILKALDNDIKNYNEDIQYLDPTEIPYQLAHLSSQERCSLKMLDENIGTYKYLRTLHKQQLKGEDPDPCPICKCVLNLQWNIMTCGHCFCIECMQVLIGQQIGFNKRQFISCPVCRKTIRVSDISYIHKDSKDATNSSNQIKGNCSSKVEAIVRLILELKEENAHVKILVFSTWAALLKLMQSIFILNDIKSEVLQSGNFDKPLSNFKDTSKGVTVLLIPVNLGGKGLNLIEATHMIFTEPLLNPGEELQAIGRVHRIGQTKSTVVHKFFIKDTIEERIYQTLASKSKEWDTNLVTLGHFKELFDFTSPEILPTNESDSENIMDVNEPNEVVQEEII